MNSSIFPRSAYQRRKLGRLRLRHRTRRQKRQLAIEAFEPRIVLSGTPQIIDLNPTGSSMPEDFTQVGDVSFFVADDGFTGRELWVTDGTANGTSLVKDILPGADSSEPTELTNVNGTLYFAANDGNNGQELWKSDGTSAGTVMVRDINPGEGIQYPIVIPGPLQSFPREPIELNGVVLFSAEDAVDGAELWQTDGTTSGTTLVKDIATGTFTDSYGTYPNSSNPIGLVVVNGTLFFSADDSVNGQELWKSDGTAAGTVMVKDIYPGTYTYSDDGYTYGPYPNASQPTQLTAVDGTLFFVAQDEQNGAELWKSDGTEAGTVLVANIAAGDTDSLSENSAMVNVDGVLMFVANDGINGEELWRSDGTAAGTALVKDITPGSGGNFTDFGGPDFTVANGTLFFSADDGTNGRELWKSDGTNAGTVMVKDISPGTDPSNGIVNSAYPFYLHEVDGTLFFSAGSVDTGRELWQSDGTEAGTVLVADIVTEIDSVAGRGVGSYPSEISSLNGILIFSADDAGMSTDLNRELWILSDTVADDAVQLTVFTDSQPAVIPMDIGVNADGTTADVFTTSPDGTLTIVAGSTLTVGDFFDTWRTDAGLAGNNPDADFSATTLLGNTADTTNTVQMFVNGELSADYENHVMRDGDNIVLVYGSNPVVSVNTNFGPIVIELFEGQTPGTVDNFLNYINDGDYLNSFFHRSDPNFVIQGGGFRTTSTTFTDTSQFTAVPTDPPIQNEPGISNLRGTVAMAKTSNPDSATSQFFVNLSANTSLDSPANSGGFTVFAQVLDMSTVDAIEALPIDTTNFSPYGELPVSSDGQLAVVQAIEGNGDLTGVKFFDENANGVLDGADMVLAGVSIYVDANDNGQLDSGEVATTTDSDGRFLLQVEPGTYVLRAEVGSGRVTTLPLLSDSYTVTVEIGREVSDLDFGETVLSPPTDVDLLNISDTGLADDDDRTNLNNSSFDSELQFQVDGVISGAEVRIYSDGVLIGAAQAFSDTVTVNTDGSTALMDGSHDITATQIFNGGESDFSTALVVTIDTTPPAAIDNVAPDLAQAEQAYSFDANSPDEGNAGVTYSLIGEPAGMAIDGQSGELTWTPTAEQVLPQSFEIVIADEFGRSSSQTVELTVLGVIPAFPDMYTTDEDQTLIVTDEFGVLANDGDVDSGSLTAAIVDQPSNGTVTLNDDGSFIYMPGNNFFGVDSFTYRAADENDESNVAKVTITVNAVNDPVITVPDSYSAQEDTTLAISVDLGVLSNDADVDDDELTATIETQPLNGSVTLNADGSFSYTPTSNYSGTDSFTYRTSDGVDLSEPVTVSLTVAAVNDPPSTTVDGYSVNEDDTLTIDVSQGLLSNDTDVDSTLTATTNTQPVNGTLVLNDDGSFTYTPNANFFGADSFTYIASDGSIQSPATTVTLSVLGQPDPPTASDDSDDAPNDGSSQSIDVLSNDTSDPDAEQTLTISSVTQGTAGGTVTFTDGTLSYAAPIGFVGTDSFTYTIQDTDGLTDTATVEVDVVESATSTLSGFVYIDRDNDGERETNEAGVPGALITLTGTANSGDTVNRTVITSNTGFYSFDELASGTYQVTETQPQALIDGTDSTDMSDAIVEDDRFTNIVLSGGQDLVENNFGEASIHPSFISITFFFASSAPLENEVFRELVATGEENAGNMDLAASIRSGSTDGLVNTPPVATADVFDVDEGAVLDVSVSSGVLANDADTDGDTLTATIETSTTDGSLNLDADGSFIYTPNSGFSGTDSFTYRASDGLAASNTASVTINVGSEANTFTVADDIGSGTLIGAVTAPASLSDARVFEIVDSDTVDALKLLPDDHMSGDPAAPLVLIEYLDLQCPTCQTFHPIVEDLEAEFDDELLVVRRHLPLTSIHQNAFAAAQSAEAAARQGAFKEMADLMFENQRDWEFVTDPQPFFDSYASDIGLDLVQFTVDRQDPEIDARIQRDIDVANSLGAAGTPTFYLNGRSLDLNDALDDFEELIDDELDDFDAPFVVNRLSGELFLAPGAVLNADSNPMRTLTVNVTDDNGVTFPVPVTVNVTDASAPQAAASAAATDQALADWN